MRENFRREIRREKLAQIALLLSTKTQWKNHVNKLGHAYNCTKHSSTGYSPYYLMFGRVPRLPIDLILRTCSSTTLSQSSYVETCKNQMKEAYQLAFQHSNERKTKDVIRRNTNRPCLTTLEPGDRVLIRNLSERGGTCKMRTYWEVQIYIIVSSIANDPNIYKIILEHNPKGKIRTVHRNMLMHCDSLLDNFDWNIREPAS